MSTGVRDDFGVLPVVFCESTRRADRAFAISLRYVALQERRVCNFHLVERKFVIEWADGYLRGAQKRGISFPCMKDADGGI